MSLTTTVATSAGRTRGNLSLKDRFRDAVKETLLFSCTMTRPQPPPVLDQSLVQVLLGALLAEPIVLTILRTITPPEPPHWHLGRPWPRR